MVTKAITANVTGGSALERHLRDIERALGRGAHVRVGFLEDAQYPATDNGKRLHVAQVAFWNNYGTTRVVGDGKKGERVVHVPARPFMQRVVESKSPRWGQLLGAALKKADYDAEKALAIAGEVIQGQVRQTIRDWTQPPNAESTVERKGFNKPLTDTQLMLRSVDYQVLSGLEGDDE